MYRYFCSYMYHWQFHSVLKLQFLISYYKKFLYVYTFMGCYFEGACSFAKIETPKNVCAHCILHHLWRLRHDRILCEIWLYLCTTLSENTYDLTKPVFFLFFMMKHILDKLVIWLEWSDWCGQRQVVAFH